MTNDQDYPDKPSRRVFSKSVATALILAPLTISSTCRKPKDKCPELGSPAEPHEPPIIIGGGSLTMECEKPMIREQIQITIPPPRMYLYKFDAYRYGKMVRLEVITEYEKLFTYECHPLADLSSPTLKVWLQRYQSNAWEAADIDPQRTDSHLYLRYHQVQAANRNFDEAKLETDKEFGAPQLGYKLLPTYKHAHAGYGANVHFRIGRWQLLEGTSVVQQGVVGPREVTGSGSGHPVEVVGFQIIPRFNHRGALLQGLEDS
jgi:hypothetical protein